jgi:4-hydroxy-tetrahydrodipicolinate synthase
MRFEKQGLKQALTGISGILVTPFNNNDDLAPERQGPIVDRAIAAGVHILVANGNTGEFYALTSDEAETMVHATAGHVSGRVPLIAGVGRGVRDACRLARASAEAGADALMIHQPPDPFVAPRGIVDYVRHVSEASGGLPLVIYLRNDAIGVNGIEALCAVEGVVGVKWATPNPLKLAEAMAACDPDIVWVGGLAEVWAPPLYAVGARGFTSGLINVWPQRSVAIHAALERGDYAEARRLIAGMRAFEDIRAQEMNGTNVTGVKAALRFLGHDCGRTRPPSAWPLTEAQSKMLAEFVEANGLDRLGGKPAAISGSLRKS